jgi:PAS domain S-box-containing protein
LFPHDRPAKTPQLLAKVERTGTVERIETVRLKKDGTKIHVTLTLSPIHRSDGRVVDVSILARDISESKRMEEMLLQAQKMEAAGQWTGGLAHDINNLLGVS